MPLPRRKTVTLTAPEKERTGSRGSALAPNIFAASQAEGLRVLLSFAVSRAEDLLDEIALREEQALTGPMEVVQEPGVPLPPMHQRRRQREADRRAQQARLLPVVGTRPPRPSCGAVVRGS